MDQSETPVVFSLFLLICFELNNDSLPILIDFYRHSFIIDSLFRLISFVTFTSYNYSQTQKE
jgi:hypothetical protein